MRALIFLLALIATPAMAAPTVAIEQGTLAGASADGIDAYKGIPYAAPPVGPLRWRAPQAAPHWQRARDANAFGPACPQHPTEGAMLRANLPQSEDCLTLNVWAPDQRHGKLPVMVWIHGGGFTQGSASLPRFDGTGLAQHGVVIVTLNYRLGRLGFFAYPGLEETNFGLLDQIAALQWVKRNIAAFGGDPGNVTLFGESAGGAAVDALMVSPLAQGLFTKAISESGGLFQSDSLAEARSNAFAFAGKLHATDLAALRALSADQMITDDESGPILDGHVLVEDVAEAFSKGHMAHIPYLAGSNSNEGSQLGSGNSDWLLKPYSDSGAAMRALYNQTDEAEFRRELFSDRFFAGPAAGLARYASDAGASAYVYRFDVLTDVARRRGETGAIHGGELVFVFGFGPLAVFAPPQDVAACALMQSYWTNFAKTGDPNGAGLPSWPRFEGVHPQTLVIDDKPHAVADFRKAQFEAAMRH
ncbi:MAG TPA: carboxylesterase family protein [Rhizomicrobium sp.]|nr:carboxylesterase family protein [Rhizomicrobium sp.]